DSITNPDQMFANANINLIKARATHVDAKEKVIELSDGGKVPYDKMILAVGATQVVPQIEGRDLEGVFTLRQVPDAEKIRAFIEEREPKKVVFIGAGFISLEMATLLSASRPNHYDMTVIGRRAHPLPFMLDTEMAVNLEKYLAEKGLTMKMGEEVTKITGQDGRVAGVEVATGQVLDADMVVVGVGARANLELANEMGLETGRYGIKVNQFLETSNPDVLAAGDCVEKIHLITKKPVSGQIRGPAVIQGRLAAKRLAGYDIPFPGVLISTAVKLFDKTIAATGLTEAQAQDSEGFETVSAVVDSRSKHGMISGTKPWTIKLVFDKKTQRLIGGQIISDSQAPAKEIDTVCALIQGEKTISDVTTFVCAGHPDCSSEPSLEPIAIAAEQALQKLKK
ncbi:MAG: FAD-dependent oxidoreductase, partial [Thermodesulfobacteriota bacterium]|nr:FAD-dependent oxidoreductase [Thermodesulfobacteriota bacterium]